ncbi:MAG: EAL domain-containing protein, partial [Nitriliruptoraceae bacterium]
GAWVLRRACLTAAGWTLPDQPAPTISVNLSPRQLRDADLIRHIRAALEESGLDPHRLVLELTESALIAQPEVAVEQLRRIKHLGIRLAIDDFGSGYASLSYLRQFPADVIKIDRSYTGSIQTPGDVPAMVRGILDLGRTLELETIAEGIETSAQLDCLTAEGCVFGQGYLFAQAVDEEDVSRLLVGRS